MSEFYKTLLNPRGKYGYWGIGIMVVIGAALMVVPGIFLGESGSQQRLVISEPGRNQTGYSLAEIEKLLAAELGGILGQVAGAGKVSVSVTLENGPEQNYAQNTSIDRSTVEERDAGGGTRVTTGENSKTEMVFANNSSAPLVVKETAPVVRGVLVVAEGAADSEIKAKLSRAVQTVLNLPAHKVVVLPKERGELP